MWSQGLISVRAFRLQQQFKLKHQDLLDASTRCFWPLVCTNRWLSIRIEFLGTGLVFLTAFASAVLLPQRYFQHCMAFCPNFASKIGSKYHCYVSTSGFYTFCCRILYSCLYLCIRSTSNRYEIAICGVLLTNWILPWDWRSLGLLRMGFELKFGLEKGYPVKVTNLLLSFEGIMKGISLGNTFIFTPVILRHVWLAFCQSRLFQQ